jgi:hypothetical protein
MIEALGGIVVNFLIAVLPIGLSYDQERKAPKKLKKGYKTLLCYLAISMLLYVQL